MLLHSDALRTLSWLCLELWVHF